MPLNIKDLAAHATARELAPAPCAQKRRRLADRLDEIADHCAALPVLRDRSVDGILGYGDMPTFTDRLQP
jgi:hypothetical protein